MVDGTGVDTSVVVPPQAANPAARTPTQVKRRTFPRVTPRRYRENGLTFISGALVGRVVGRKPGERACPLHRLAEKRADELRAGRTPESEGGAFRIGWTWIS